MKRSALSKLLLAAGAVLPLCMSAVMAQSTDTTLPGNKDSVQTENAAPSEHIFYYFRGDGIAKIHKVKIVQSADAEYFSVHNFRGGYDGLQQTPDNNYGARNILLASLWDPNTAGKVFSRVAYAGTNTFTSRFGGEGDGWKTMNPYKWVTNVWYNIAIRAWKNNGQFYIATFIQNTNTGVWFHSSTLAEPDRPGFLGTRDDAFLENWDGTSPLWDGRFVRKAYFKDCWNLDTGNVWQKHIKRFFNANDGDKARNGKYDRSFNAGYDAKEDAYFMQHGGNTQPDEAFGTGRRIELPEQTHQGDAPQLTVGAIIKLIVAYNNQSININWVTDARKSPQLSSKIEIVDASGKIVQTEEEVLPEKRSASIKVTLPAGKYIARVTITDIFNQTARTVAQKFVVE